MSKRFPNLAFIPLFHADVKLSKRRQPFVPYALRNHTGCTMWFATLTTTPTRWVEEQMRTFSFAPRDPRTASCGLCFWKQYFQHRR